MYDVVALGELLIDFACRSVDGDGYPTMAANPGGAPANFLAALTKYGAKTAFIGKVGADAFGKMLTSTLEKNGIYTGGLVSSEEVFTTLAFVTIDENGNREFSFSRKPGADTMLHFDEVNLSLLDSCRVFHFGTLSLTNEPSRSATYKAVEYAKAHGKLITFDPNLRKPLWSDLGRAKEEIEWGLHNADVVKISDEEVDFLWGLNPSDAAEKIIEEFGVKLVFVTCGADGCLYANRNCSGRAASPAVSPVDTTGAGDIFGGSAVCGILESGKAPEDLLQSELDAITRFACAAASLSTEKFGGISSVPDRETVIKAISE